MAAFQNSPRGNLNQVSNEGNFDTLAYHEVERSSKRQRLSCSTTSINKNVAGGPPERKRKVPSNQDFLPVHRLSSSPTKTVCASTHQNAIGQRPSEFRGGLCRSMALCALVVSTALPVDTWATHDMDAILRYGDIRQGALSNFSGDRARLSFSMPMPSHHSEWPFNPASHMMSADKSEQFMGLVHSSMKVGASQLKPNDVSMVNGLSHILDWDNTGALITIAGATGAVWRDNEGKIRYFDSHFPNNKIGRLNPNGTAVLLTFDTVRYFVRYMRSKTDSLQSRYEMTGIKARMARRIVRARRRLLVVAPGA